MIIRKEIIFFAESMERVMAKHDKMKKDSWKRMSHYELQELLLQEVEESNNENAKIKEWIDIANICMMIYCNALKFNNSQNPDNSDT